jgi:catechol-2,3-dioxygenase
MAGLHDQRIELGAVGLSVRDLDRSLAFYGRAIGLEVLERSDGRAALGIGGRHLLALEERPGAVRDIDGAGSISRCCCRRARHSAGSCGI